jgi:hypothetical protein
MKSDQELAAHLFALEECLLKPDVSRAEALADLLADEFVEFGSFGTGIR